MAIQKYGIAEVITNVGGTMLSSLLPRRQAETMPRPVPSAKASTVAMPTRPSVHQMALPMTELTEAGYWLSEMPRLPVRVWCKYVKYCESRFSCVLTPNRTSSAFCAFGLSSPWNFDSMASAGLPGISRGSRKFSVSAIHSVRTKKPRRRSAYRKLVSLLCPGHFLIRGPGPLPESPGPRRLGYLGARCRSTCSRSGQAYGAGWPYGLPWVGHPLKVPVSYWYQSTASITGMTG